MADVEAKKELIKSSIRGVPDFPKPGDSGTAGNPPSNADSARLYSHVHRVVAGSVGRHSGQRGSWVGQPPESICAPTSPAVQASFSGM
jgi:hypothetical protein